MIPAFDLFVNNENIRMVTFYLTNQSEGTCLARQVVVRHETSMNPIKTNQLKSFLLLKRSRVFTQKGEEMNVT